MGLSAAGYAAVTAATAAAGTAYSVYAGEKAADEREEARERARAAQQERFEAEKKAKQAERRIQQRRAQQERRAAIRQGQRQRSVIENIAAQTGTAESTGAGAAGRVGTQVASNYGFLQDVSRLSGRANTFRQAGEQFQNEASQAISRGRNRAAGFESQANIAQGASRLVSSPFAQRALTSGGGNTAGTIFDDTTDSFQFGADFAARN